MQGQTSFLRSLAIGFLTVIPVMASAHDLPTQKSGLVLMDSQETLELAFWADCTKPSGTDDGTVVPTGGRFVTFPVWVEDQSSSGATYLQTVELADGEFTLIDVPAATFEVPLRVAYKHAHSQLNPDASGQGPCKVLSAGRIKDSGGNTRAAVPVGDLTMHNVEADGLSMNHTSRGYFGLNQHISRGATETLELAFSADCNMQKEQEDASLVPLEEQLISFVLKIVGGTVGGTTTVQQHHIEVLSWSSGPPVIWNVPASVGQLLRISAEEASGQGVCQLGSVGRLVGPTGETRAVGLDNNMWAAIVDRD